MNLVFVQNMSDFLITTTLNQIHIYITFYLGHYALNIVVLSSFPPLETREELNWEKIVVIYELIIYIFMNKHGKTCPKINILN